MNYFRSLPVILILLIVTCNNQVQGQISINRLNEKEAPKFDKSRSVLKLGLAAIPNGKYGLAFEQEVGGVFAIEISGGLTGRNLFGSILAEAIAEDKQKNQSSPNFADHMDYQDNDYEFSSRNATLGWFVTVMPRFYYLGDGIGDSYLGLNLQYRKYNFEAYQLALGQTYFYEPEYDPSLPTIDEFETNTIIGATVGRQTLFSKMEMDWYISTGINLVNAERRDIGYKEIPGTTESTLVMGSQPREISEIRFYFEIGFQMGFWWD